jgi:hypothetical protein
MTPIFTDLGSGSSADGGRRRQFATATDHATTSATDDTDFTDLGSGCSTDDGRRQHFTTAADDADNISH